MLAQQASQSILWLHDCESITDSSTPDHYLFGKPLHTSGDRILLSLEPFWLSRSKEGQALDNNSLSPGLFVALVQLHSRTKE